jgi:uncharacterized lipoprotein YbaY
MMLSRKPKVSGYAPHDAAASVTLPSQAFHQRARPLMGTVMRLRMALPPSFTRR